jgi:hypothetical protein
VIWPAHAFLVTYSTAPFGGGVVNDFLRSDNGFLRSDPISQHLASLRRAYTRGPALTGGDALLESVLAEEYLREAMAFLTVGYGAACAEQVRSWTGRGTEPALRLPPTAPAPVPFLARVGRCLRRHAEDWQRQWLETGELGEPIHRTSPLPRGSREPR